MITQTLAQTRNLKIPEIKLNINTAKLEALLKYILFQLQIAAEIIKEKFIAANRVERTVYILTLVYLVLYLLPFPVGWTNYPLEYVAVMSLIPLGTSLTLDLMGDVNRFLRVFLVLSFAAPLYELHKASLKLFHHTMILTTEDMWGHSFTGVVIILITISAVQWLRAQSTNQESS